MLAQGDECLKDYQRFVEHIVQDEFLEDMKDHFSCVFLGCLITDIFRVYAPNNPFESTDKIKVSFSTFSTTS